MKDFLKAAVERMRWSSLRAGSHIRYDQVLRDYCILEHRLGMPYPPHARFRLFTVDVLLMFAFLSRKPFPHSKSLRSMVSALRDRGKRLFPREEHPFLLPFKNRQLRDSLRAYDEWSMVDVRRAFALVLVVIHALFPSIDTLLDLQDFLRCLLSHGAMLRMDDIKRGKMTLAEVEQLPNLDVITHIPPGKFHKTFEPAYFKYVAGNRSSFAYMYELYRDAMGMSSRPQNSYLFPSVSLDDTVNWANPSSDSAFMKRISNRAKFIGMPDSVVDEIRGHSFRSGGCTDYIVAGCPAPWIKRQGRWASDAYLIYFRRTRYSLGSVSAQMFDKILRHIAA